MSEVMVRQRTRPHTIPPRAVPLVRRLFEEMNRADMSCDRLVEEAGICRETLIRWRKGTPPKLADIEACLNVFGLTLRPVPFGEGGER